ncbi:MAG TPA: histidine phosphatase family protein [Thermoanaerobaculia bacterium]|nr:histidine phosphatase family protein [Thermoanaerobaculia bacterium]
MLTLLLMRHAKSDWESSHQSDHDRPLSKRGIKAAGLMGEVLTATDSAPDLVVTSSAERARRTAELAHEAGGWSCPVLESDALYASRPETVLEAVKGLHGEPSVLLLVGHEPVWSQLLSELVGGGSFRFPTAAVAAVELAIPTWADLAPGNGQLLWFVTPRFLTPFQ